MRAARLLLFILFLPVSSFAAITVVGSPEFEADENGTLTAVFVDVEIDTYGIYRLSVTSEEVTFMFSAQNDLTAATKTAIRSALRTKALALRAKIIARRQKEATEDQNARTRRGQIQLDPGDLN